MPPISDVQFFVTESDGTVVGDGNGYFVTDSAGTILIEGIDPGTTLVVKETRAKPGYLLDDVPQTATIKAGQTVTLEFRNKPLGNLIVHKLSSADKKDSAGRGSVQNHLRRWLLPPGRGWQAVLQWPVLDQFLRGKSSSPVSLAQWS